MARILLIEDEAEVSKYLRMLLERMKHEVETAADGTQGFARAGDDSFDLIITDLRMPGEPSEMDLVRAIREKRPATPLVVVSGHPTPERLEECETLGITDFLTKPFEIDFIRSVLNKALRDHD
jgi:DNA-binding NtrC family response regulator